MCNITDPVIVTDLLHFYGYYHVDLKHYADLTWMCAVDTSIIDILF